MRKEYINPEIEILNFTKSDIMIASEPTLGGSFKSSEDLFDIGE